MNPRQQFLSQLNQYAKFVSHISFERVGLSLRRLVSSSYLDNLNVLMVTGTNGKGSTSLIANEILGQHDIKVGLLTSPHFIELNERIQIAGQPVDYQALNQAFDEVKTVVDSVSQQLGEAFGVYDILFLVAITVFFRHQTNTLMIEAGIGGRYDPGRLLKPKLTALTSVDLDHTDILGKTTELIAFDKLDACQSHGKVITGNIDQRLLAKIIHYTGLNQIEVVDAQQAVNVTMQKAGQVHLALPQQEAVSAKTALLGDFQLHNIKTAITLCQVYLQHQQQHQQHQQHKQQEAPSFIQKCALALQNIKIPGRFEQICEQPTMYVDAAHTPDAYQLFFDSLSRHFNDQPMIFLTGQSEGRDHAILVEQLQHLASEIIVSQAHTRGQAAEVLYQHLQQTKDKPVLHLCPDLIEATALAKKRAIALNGRVFVVGGLFLSGEVAAIHRGLDHTGVYVF